MVYFCCRKLKMKSVAVFLILSLAVVAVMSEPQNSGNANQDPCQLRPVAGAKCGWSADFGKCIACVVEKCYAQAIADGENCEAHKLCINNAACN
jgi:hypothetical protein